MAVVRARGRLAWRGLGALLFVGMVAAMAHCSASPHDVSADSGAPPVEASPGGNDSGPVDATGSDGKVIQGIGSKCLTVCPMNLTCDPYKWKGFCTKSCTSDSDCQGTGDPPVKGVCASDGQCYKACDPTSDPCTRTLWTCVGPPGDMYCNNFYDAHYEKPETGTSSGGGPSDATTPTDDGGDGGTGSD
jgi:hypothetical protein